MHYNYNNLSSVNPEKDKFGYYHSLKKKNNEIKDLAMKKYFDGIKDDTVKNQLVNIDEAYKKGDWDAGDQAINDFKLDKIQKNKYSNVQN